MEWPIVEWDHKIGRWPSTPHIRKASWTNLLFPIRDYEDWTPSNYITNAWDVVERISELTKPLKGERFPPSTIFAHWFNRFDLWAYSAPEAAHAICIAALGSLKVDVDA